MFVFLCSPHSISIGISISHACSGISNLQVQQKSIEAVILIATNATRFSKKCVVLCLTGSHLMPLRLCIRSVFYFLSPHILYECQSSVGGVLTNQCFQSIFNFYLILIIICFCTGVVEKVGDIKTRIQATKCLTTFCEAVGPKFVFERV